MRWLSTAARTLAPKRVYSTVPTSSSVIASADRDQEQPVDGKAQTAK